MRKRKEEVGFSALTRGRIRYSVQGDVANARAGKAPGDVIDSFADQPSK